MNTLLGSRVMLHLPQLFEIDGKFKKCRLLKLRRPATVDSIHLSSFSRRTIRGLEGEIPNLGRILLLPKSTTSAFPEHNLIVVPGYRCEKELAEFSSMGKIFWHRPKPIHPKGLSILAAENICKRIRKSWVEAINFVEEIRDDDGRIIRPGLRPPQLGALHATLAHWSVSKKPATIVMPTGTGKTETMLALLTATGIERLMVVVPNSALKDQIADKFISLGVLKKFGILDEQAETPVVAILDGRPRTTDEVVEIFSKANVIITTMQVAGQCDESIQEKMAELCSHLFIDEAHHIAAKTWQNFKGKFVKRVVVQFTATPFRTDGKRVDGKFIYVYPLAKAQNEGYFRPISFRAIQGLDEVEADIEIIRLVGSQLREDLHKGFDHLVMARARNIKRAEILHRLYQDHLGEFNPVLLNSEMNPRDKHLALSKLQSRDSRIIICVDMLGEGFDLPQLKISGLHDKHKSVAITLQFTGRFTRDSDNIGSATVIANIDQSDVDDALRTLYAEDADWNYLLNVLSDTKTGRQIKRSELMAGFSESLEGIPLQTLVPKMSTVVYKTDCAEWRPQEIEAAMPIAAIQAGPVINDAERIALFVTREESSVRWSTTKEINDVQWNLFLVHWDYRTKLLYINSSKAKELHENLAKAIAGGSATRIVGEAVYRVLHGINRLVLMNLGLSSMLGRNIRYAMFVGSDITAQIADAQFTSKRKSNLFGIGYTGDGSCTIGCSAKGKFWSMQSAADFNDWLKWCHEIGAKATDNSIGTDDFIRNLVKQKQICERPHDKPVIAVHWPESFLIDFEERINLRFGANDWVGFYECEIEPTNHDPNSSIQFTVSSGDHSAIFEVSLSENGAKYNQVDGPEVIIQKGTERPLSEVFGEDPPHIYFADSDFLIFNELFSIPRDQERQSFNPERIRAYDWTGVDFSKESQGIEKRKDSIQYRMIQTLKSATPSYSIIFDDDGAGEIADIVTLRQENDCLFVDLFHLKYSHGSEPGSRVADLYEVCGQAQKSIRWMEYPIRILKRMQKREKDRIKSGSCSRFDHGSLGLIRDFMSRSKIMERRYKVWIVQPGISKASIEPKQLDLLAATESFLLDTYGASLEVVGSL